VERHQNDRFSSTHLAAFNYRFMAVCAALIFVPHKVPHHFVTFLSRKINIKTAKLTCIGKMRIL
jgi:hypothetical protein